METGIEPGSRTPVGCVTSGPPSQLQLRSVVKLFNCFKAIGWNVNKESQIYGPRIFNKKNLYIFTYMDNYNNAVSHIYGSMFNF